MYKCTLIDKHNCYEDLMLTDKADVTLLMHYVWNRCGNELSVNVFKSEDDFVVGIVLPEEEKNIYVHVADADSAGMLVSYVMANDHFANGDEFCARPVEDNEPW